MPTLPQMPGLDRLIAVCQRHSLPLRLDSALPFTPASGESSLGEPLDPQLAATYQRLGGAEFGPLTLFRPGPDWLDLMPWNERLRRHGAVHFRASLIFCEETGFPLYYGTVPRLADAQGVQPVIHVDGSEAQYGIPVASSVDRFFDTYSRHLELMIVDPEYVHHGIARAQFPWSVQEIIAEDTPLLEQVRAGRFDFLSNGHQDALEWFHRLRGI
jgi:hypothetical protein